MPLQEHDPRPAIGGARGIRRLLTDRHSGSSLIATAACRHLEAIARHAPVGKLPLQIRKSMAALIAAHPAMALLHDLSDTLEIILRRPDRVDPHGLRRAIRNSLQGWLHALTASREQVAAIAVRHLPRHAPLLLLSYSGTVLAACRALARKGGPAIVICESRPVCEGALMARHLARAGCGVTVIADAAAGSWIDRVSAVVLGADWVDRRGFVNKTGSRVLSRLAAQARIPVFVLADSARVRNRVFREEDLPDHDPAELLTRPCRGLTVHNRHFERVAWAKAHRLLLESGLFVAPARQWQRITSARILQRRTLGNP